MTVRPILAVMAALACVTGCTVNSNRALSAGALPAPGRAVLVYGVGLDAPWHGTAFPLELVAYDIDRQNIDGNCFRFNRTEARTASAPSGVRYFAFDVVPGYYTLSPFLPVPSTARESGFHAPAGATVYAGTFIYQAGDRVALVRDFSASKAAIVQALPQLDPGMSAATPLAIEPARMFMCTP